MRPGCGAGPGPGSPPRPQGERSSSRGAARGRRPAGKSPRNLRVGALAPAPRLKPSQLRRARAGTCFQGGISSSGQPHQGPRLAFIARELKAPALHQGHGDEEGALGPLGSRARAPTVRRRLLCITSSTSRFFPSPKSKLQANLLHGTSQIH